MGCVSRLSATWALVDASSLIVWRTGSIEQTMFV
jgi:hypothetical protein